MQAVIGNAESEKERQALMPRGKDRARARHVARFLILLLLIWPPLAWLAAKGLIVRAELPHADVLVVLGGSSTYIERTQRAAQIYSEGRVAKIVLTNDGQQGGWSEKEQRNPWFVEHAAQELQRAGVPAEKIEILPQIVSSTYEEAQLLHKYAITHSLQSLLIVTSAYHSRRANWAFRRVFQSSSIAVGIEPALTGHQTPSPSAWWLHLRGWRMVPVEYMKLVYYIIKY